MLRSECELRGGYEDKECGVRSFEDVDWSLPEPTYDLGCVQVVGKDDLHEFREAMIEGMRKVPDISSPGQIERWENELVTDAPPPSGRMHLMVRDDQGNIVAGLEGEVRQLEGMPIGYIMWVYVDESCRRQELGLKLIKGFEASLVAREEPVYYLLANIDRDNESSLQLHRKAGFNHLYLRKEGIVIGIANN